MVTRPSEHECIIRVEEGTFTDMFRRLCFDRHDTMPKVILIEEDNLVRALLKKRLEAADWIVTALCNSKRLFEIQELHSADLLVLEHSLRNSDGAAILGALRDRGINLPCIVIACMDLGHLPGELIMMGVGDIITKPYDQEDLLQRMQRLLAA